MQFDVLTTDWKIRPEGGVSTRHRFAIGDIHGRADLLKRMLDHINHQPYDGSPRDIIFTGDYVDRGPNGIGAIRLAMNADQICDRRVMLPGNHEIMMIDGLDPADVECDDINFWVTNGGDAVVCEVIPPDVDMPVRDAKKVVRDALPAGFIELMETGPHHLWEDDLIFVHAGINPHIGVKETLSAPLRCRESSKNHWSWVRKPFLTWEGGWDADRSGNLYKGATLVIHGHTIEREFRVADEDDLLMSADRAATHRRLSIDTGGYAFGCLTAVEFSGERYRFHSVSHWGFNV